MVAMVGWVAAGVGGVCWLVSMLDKARRYWSHVGGHRNTCSVRGVDTDDIRPHSLTIAQLWVGSSENWSVSRGRPYHRTLQNGSCSLSMQPVGCTPLCSTDAVWLVLCGVFKLFFLFL